MIEVKLQLHLKISTLISTVYIFKQIMPIYKRTFKNGSCNFPTWVTVVPQIEIITVSCRSTEYKV